MNKLGSRFEFRTTILGGTLTWEPGVKRQQKRTNQERYYVRDAAFVVRLLFDTVPREVLERGTDSGVEMVRFTRLLFFELGVSWTSSHFVALAVVESLPSACKPLLAVEDDTFRSGIFRLGVRRGASDTEATDDTCSQ